jgi:hypothetical protein
MVLSSAGSVVYANDDISSTISTQINKKKDEYINMKGGKVELDSRSEVSYKDEVASSITTTTTNVNKQEVSGSGDVVIKTGRTTSYSNVKTPVIVDVNLDINTVLVDSDDVNVTVEKDSETNLDNVQAKYVYQYDKSYTAVAKKY